MAETALDIELVNKPLVKAWGWWALVWLTVFPFVGILVSIQFHNPEFQGGMPWFTFGRLRSVHLGGVLFGSFTTAFIGLLYYFVPRLCGTPLYKVEWGWLLWMWNVFSSLTLGFATSAAEEIAKLVPDAHVVKAFNTVFAQGYASQNPKIQGKAISVFVAGDNTEAKEKVQELITKMGFDVVDAGPLKSARNIEPLAMLNISLGYGQGLGTSMEFTFLR